MKAFKIFVALVLLGTFSYGKVIKLGIFPYIDPIQIAKMYQPLKLHLEKNNHDKVEIFSARSFEEFYAKTKQGEFDIVITPPHLGVIHLKDGFSPIYRYDVFLTPFFVVKNDSPITKTADLKDKKVALSNHLSVSSISGIIDLEANGIEVDDNKIVDTKTHQAAVLSVIFGESDVAITTLTALKQMEKNLDLKKVKYFKGTIKIPHVFTIAHPKVDKATVANFKKWLNEFEASEEGKAFLTSAGFMGYTDITDDDLKKMQPFMKETMRVINRAK